MEPGEEIQVRTGMTLRCAILLIAPCAVISIIAMLVW